MQEAARGLRYRDFLTVALVIDGEDLFPDNWIYIHEPGVRVGRIQNFRSWSPWMVPDPSKASVGLEYFCFQGDDLWDASDDDLVALATDEIERLGLAAARQGRARVRHTRAARVPDVRRRLRRARGDHPRVARDARRTSSRSAATDCTATTTPTTRCSRRSGRSRTSLDGTDHDLWAVNAESVYHEEDVADEHPYKRAPDTTGMREPLAYEG